MINVLVLEISQFDFLLHNEAGNTTKSTLKTEYESLYLNACPQERIYKGGQANGNDGSSASTA